ncbi:MAG: hypothetical protein WKI04_18950 [Ferruginibacter sp.]
MTVKKARILLCIQVIFLLVTSCAYSQSIKDTKKFLEYFNGIDNMTSYKKLKETIQTTGTKIQASSAISDTDKLLLKDLYNLVKDRTDSLIDRITSDLLSKPERKKMVKDPAAYVTSLNIIFEDIKITTNDFNTKYTEVAGPTRGRMLSLRVKSFELPLDKKFAEELLTAALRALIQKQVKKKISLKSWDDL